MYRKRVEEMCQTAPQQSQSLQGPISLYVVAYVHVCVCWASICVDACINAIRGVGEGIRSNTSKRESVEGDMETPSHKVITLLALPSPFLSVHVAL